MSPNDHNLESSKALSVYKEVEERKSLQSLIKPVPVVEVQPFEKA